MKLTFRGCSYEVPDPIQPQTGSTDQPKIKLIYRALTYYVNLPAAMTSKAVEADGSTVTLIYRTNTYQRKLQFPQPYQQLCALNCRYQIRAEG